MFSKIMVPVVLQHTDRMARTLEVAEDLARQYEASIIFVAVTGKVPNAIARTAEGFAAALDLFARELSDRAGIPTESLAVFSNDPAAELEKRLLEAVKSTGADLVVMGSHPPGVADALHLIGSHSAWLVRHSDVSVFVVR
jgi:nucleotide-binding universal stress UspA family protein